MSWTESASENVDDENNTTYMQSVMNKSIRFYSSVNIGIIACMPCAINFLVNQSFAKAYYYIPILMTAAFFHSIANLYGSIYTAYKMTKEIAKTTVLAAVLNIGINTYSFKENGKTEFNISEVKAITNLLKEYPLLPYALSAC